MTDDDIHDDNSNELAPKNAPEIVDGPHEEHEDEHGSLAAKVLSGAAILLTGGVIALWAGPKIAPVLPSGMAPIAAWLTPGATSDEAIASLRADLEARIDGLPASVSSSEIATMIEADTGAISATLSEKITALSDQLRATDSGDIEARLAALELKTDGVRAELSALTTQLSNVAVEGGTMSAETMTQITTYAAALEGLKAELANLAAQNGALSQKLDDVAATAARQVAEAEAIVTAANETTQAEKLVANVQASINAIGVALDAGVPFRDAATTLTDAGLPVSADLLDAQNGVVTMAQLRADFPDAAHAAIRASILQSTDSGLFASASRFLQTQVATRSLTPQEGDSVDAILSRAEEALRQDDLAAALDEINTLPAMPDTHEVMANWIASATTRQKAMTAYEALATTPAAE